MKRILLAAILMGCASLSFAQKDSTSNWTLQAIYGLKGTQSSFVNWNAGGQDNISAIGSINASSKYLKGDMKWDSDLALSLGGIDYLSAGSPKGLAKTDDKIDLATNFGYRMKKDWYYSILGSFKTQFMDGFATPEDNTRSSKFMVPGYLTLALGLDYSPNKNFSFFISPLASKMTFVQDRTFADAGSFGVEAAYIDDAGVYVAGKKFRGEFGAYVRIKYDKELAKNIFMKSKVELFSNYLDRPENIDVNADIIFDFKVNNWFSASLNWTLIYDHDIIFRGVKNGTAYSGPRTQFKSVLGVGLTHTMKN